MNYKREDIVKPRYCFSCGTIFQLFCILCIIEQSLKSEIDKGSIILDLFIDNRVAELDYVNLDIIKSTAGISNIYVYNFQRTLKNSRIYNILAKLFTKSFLKYRILSLSGCHNQNYDKLYICKKGDFNKLLVYANKNAEIDFFYGGLGTNAYDIFTKNVSGFDSLYINKFNIDPEIFVPKSIWVFGQITSEYLKNCKINAIVFNPNNKEFLEKLNASFNYKFNNLYNNRFIYCTQPIEDFKRLSSNGEQLPGFDTTISEELIRIINPLVRYHPRQKRFFETQNIDDSNNLWELLAVNDITENHVIISICSTAQIMPKILCNKEPFLVFMYKLYEEILPQEILESWERFIQDLKSTYLNPEKIIILEKNNWQETIKDYFKIDH